VWLALHSGTRTTFAVKELFKKQLPQGQPDNRDPAPSDDGNNSGDSGDGKGDTVTGSNSSVHAQAQSLSQPQLREFRKEAELMADLSE